MYIAVLGIYAKKKHKIRARLLPGRPFRLILMPRRLKYSIIPTYVSEIYGGCLLFISVGVTSYAPAVLAQSAPGAALSIVLYSIIFYRIIIVIITLPGKKMMS